MQITKFQRKMNLKELNHKELLKKVRAVFIDVDGVLSSSNLQIDDNGKLIRTTNVKDGYILKYAVKKGIKICIITGGLNLSIKYRYEALGIEDVIIGSKRKIIDVDSLLKKHNLSYNNLMYIGDDIPDYEVMQKCLLPCCPADAADEIKSISLYISDKNGGKGCVRDILEQLLRAKNLWMNDEDAFIMNE